MSGSALNKTWSLVQRNNQAERLARNLGWKGKAEDEANILEFLENVPAFELDDASKTLLTDEEQFGYGTLIPFGPVIEPYATDSCFVSKNPVEMARETWTNDIDLIVMGSSFEGIYRIGYKEEEAARVLQNPSFFLPLLDLGLTPSDERAATFGEIIKRLYYNSGKEPSLDNQEQFLRVSTEALAKKIKSNVFNFSSRLIFISGTVSIE